MSESALALIESVKDSRVLFVGDTITDEYHYVKPLNKAAKENLIPVRYGSKETFAGGVIAAAKHLQSFCKVVDINNGGKITRKVRFVDENSLHKLFEIHYQDGECISLKNKLEDYDCVVVADFGHGVIKDVSEFNSAKYLAVSAQTNAANRGFNLITKYPRADYIVIDEPEARLAAANQDGPINDVIHKLADGRCEKFIVTHGRHGAYGYHKGQFAHCNAFTDLVRDTMGAGDAFFAITAPMSKTGSIEDLLFIGCAAGALKCGILGHRSSVTKEALCDFIRTH